MYCDVKQNYESAFILMLLLFMPFITFAEIVIKIEKGRRTDSSYVFDTIPSPSTADVAANSKVSIVDNRLDAGGADASWIVNGVVSASSDKPKQAVFFTNNNADGGKILMDIGSMLPVTMINTYSSHEFSGDQGARAPQVYMVYGSRADAPVTSDPANDDNWTKIAEVDSRPNTTGENWGGIHGVSISDTKGNTGEFRYLLWDVQPTRSPLQSDARWTNTFFAEFDVHTGDSLRKDEPARLAGQNRNVEEVIVVFKTHFDIGFTDLAKNVVQRYRTTMIDHALDVVEASKSLPADQRFVWTVPGWPMTKILEDWDGQTAERKQKVWDAFKAGRFVVHALPYTLHTESTELEDLVRGMGYSSKLCREIGKELPHAAKMTDVPSHSCVLPTLLKHAGVDFLHLGCNPASQSPQVPLMYWWEGPDGSRLLTMYVGQDYGTGLIPPEDWPHKTWLAMIMTGDNHGPPSPEAVKSLLGKAQRELPSDVKVRFGTLDDFAAAILAEKPDLPVIHGDMPDAWIHGQMTSPVESGAARRARPLIVAAESVNTLLKSWGVETPGNADEIAAAFDNSIRYAEHTWAINTHYIRPRRSYGEQFEKELKEGRFARYDESWREKGTHGLNVEELVSASLNRDLKVLAGAVDVAGERIVVYNAHPWPRDGVVNLNILDFAGKSVKDLVSGVSVPVSVHKDDMVTFVAKDVPAMGYRTYKVSKDVFNASSDLVVNKHANVIENRFFKVTLKPKAGSIASVIDKRTNRELVDKNSEYDFGQYYYERFGKKEVDRFLKEYLKIHAGWAYNDLGKRDLPDIPYLSGRTANAMLSIKKDGGQVIAVMMAEPANNIDHKHSVAVTLYEDQPYIDIEWEVYNKELNAYPEAGWISLPLKIDDPQFRLARLGGVMNPARDIVENTYKDVSCVNGGLAVLDHGKSGVGLCPLDSPLVSLDRLGLWRFSRDFTPRRPNVFVNLYNNMWGTNFRQWIGGSWKSRVRLWSFGDFENEADLITPSHESRTPLVAACANGPKGKLPLSQEGVKLSRKGVLVTAFGENPDGEGLVLRLWEQAGKGGECTVTLPLDIKIQTVHPCDLRGRPFGKPIDVNNGSFDVQLKHNAPASFLID